eukprot:12930199-Prorocentrum_lima.AAC.1
MGTLVRSSWTCPLTSLLRVLPAFRNLSSFEMRCYHSCRVSPLLSATSLPVTGALLIPSMLVLGCVPF